MRGSGQSSNCRSSGGRCVLPGSVSTADGGTGVTMIVEGGDGGPIGGTVGVIPAGGRCGGTVPIGGATPPGKPGVMPSGGRCGGTVPIGGVTPPGRPGVMP